MGEYYKIYYCHFYVRCIYPRTPLLKDGTAFLMVYKLGRIYLNNFKKIVRGDYKLSYIALKLRQCEQVLTLSKFLFHSTKASEVSKGPHGPF